MTFPGGRAERRLEETKRIGRVLRILQAIGAQPRAWTRGRLAEQFEVSERMIDKDLELIRHALRYELRRGKDGYYFADGPPLRPVQLSVPELLALALAAQQARDTGTVDRGTLAGALGRLEEALPMEVVPYLRRAGLDGGRLPFGPSRDRSPVLATLEEALLTGRRLAMVYASASRGGVATERVIAPYYLLPYERSWLIVADDSLRGQVRIFKADRIQSCRLTDQRYEVPADFDLTAYFGETWGVLRGQGGPAQDVELRFSPLAAAWVRDDRYHPSQEMEELADGGLVMRFHCGVTHELVRWVLSFGSDVGVEQPGALRKEVVEAAAAVLRVANALGHPVS
jgi:predicted DNA-binding transcriptional regulator YafY